MGDFSPIENAARSGRDTRIQEPVFQSGLYEGTAADYDRYRLGYPDALVAQIRDELGLDGTGTLLDLGAGTGQVARALRPLFGHVIAVDPERDTVSYARARSELEHDGIEWRVARAEDLDFADTSLDVVAAGNAFHRFDRPVVAAKAKRWLTPGGAIALLGSDGPLNGDEAWQSAIAAVVEEWLERSGAATRIPAGWERRDYPDEVVLREAGFGRFGEYSVIDTHVWTDEAIVGFLRATSFGSRAAMGEYADSFEDAIRGALLDINSDGLYRQEINYAVQFARR